MSKKSSRRGRVSKSAKTTPVSLLEQCRRLPGQMRQVCVDAALARYDRHYHPDREHYRKHIFVDALLALAFVVAALMSAYFLFSYRQAGLHEQIDFVMSPSAIHVASGEAVGASLYVQNNTDRSLIDAYVTIPAGNGFVLSQTRPAADDTGRIMLGTLHSGQAATIAAAGSIVGPLESSVRINAVLHYRTNSLLKYEEKLVSESVAIDASRLQLTLDIPSSLVPEQPFDFTLAYENTSMVTSFADVKLVPFLPAGWETLESKPLSDAATLIWDLGNVGSLQRGEVRGRAVLHDASAAKAEVNFQLFAAPFGKPLLQAEVRNILPVYQPHVALRLSADGESVALGEEARQTVTVRNDESYPLHDLAVVFTVNTDLIDQAALPKGAMVKGNRISLPLGPSLSAKTSLDYPIIWKLRDQVNAQAAFGTADVNFHVSGEVSYRNEKNEFIVIPLPSLTSALQSDARIHAFARYYGGSGEQLGRGPLPPTVGETTKYWVFLHVANQLHPLTGARVQASLPLGVDWTGQYTLTAGDSIRFDATTRAVIWDLGDIADYKSDFGNQDLSAGFEVAITPTQAQVGDSLLLLKNVVMEARDRGTDRTLRLSAPAVDTTLDQDAYATDDGRVKL